MLDKSRKLISCVRVDYENKTGMLLNPSIQFFIDAQGNREDRYALHSVEVYMCLELNVVFIRQLPPPPPPKKKKKLKTTCKYIQNLLLIKARCILHFWINFLIILTQNKVIL